MTRLFAIGDIHGCYSLLKRLLEKLPIDWQTDKLIFLGDYIDRGEEVKKVVETIIDLKSRYKEQIICLMGNHEDMFLEYLKGFNKILYLTLGGNNTINSYGGIQNIPGSHIEFIKSLELIFETDEYIFVHAGLRPHIPVEQQSKDDLIWIRESFYESDYDWGKTIIFGHTPMASPFIRHNKIGIDTGAVYGGKLTAIELPNMKFYSVGWDEI